MADLMGPHINTSVLGLTLSHIGFVLARSQNEHMHPTENERHVDLRCWISFAAGVMAGLARLS